MSALVRDWGHPQPERFRSPVLAMELARSDDEINQLRKRGDIKKRQLAMARNVQMDYLFIALYALFIGGLAVWAAIERTQMTGWAVGFAIAAILCILSAAFFDVQENNAMLRAIENIRSSLDPAAPAIRTASLWKWRLFFASLLFVSMTLATELDLLKIAMAVLLAFTATIGGAGLIWKEPWIELSMLPLLSALALAILVLPFRTTG